MRLTFSRSGGGASSHRESFSFASGERERERERESPMGRNFPRTHVAPLGNVTICKVARGGMRTKF